MAASLLAPLAYISVLVVGMLLFSRYQRSTTKAAITAIEPWFPSHPARDIYITLLQAEPPVPDQMLMSALLNRATEDVRRIWKLRDAKQALQVLIQRGSLGDETATRFAAAEKELEAEVVEVVAEANTFKQGWGQWIFLSASEIATKDKLRQAYRDIDSVRLEEEKRLEARKALKSRSSTSSQPPPTLAPPVKLIPDASTAEATTSSATSTALDTSVKLTPSSAEMSRRGSAISDAGSGGSSAVGWSSKGTTPSKNKKKGKKK